MTPHRVDLSSHSVESGDRCVTASVFHSFFEVHFSLNNFVGWFSPYHRLSGKLLLAVGAIAEGVCIILEDTLLKTLQ